MPFTSITRVEYKFKSDESPFIALPVMRKLDGCYLHDIGGYLHSLFERKGVVLMRDYEILIVVFTVMAIIVSVLVELIKK